MFKNCNLTSMNYLVGGLSDYSLGTLFPRIRKILSYAFTKFFIAVLSPSFFKKINLFQRRFYDLLSSQSFLRQTFFILYMLGCFNNQCHLLTVLFNEIFSSSFTLFSGPAQRISYHSSQ